MIAAAAETAGEAMDKTREKHQNNPGPNTIVTKTEWENYGD